MAEYLVDHVVEGPSRQYTYENVKSRRPVTIHIKDWLDRVFSTDFAEIVSDKKDFIYQNPDLSTVILPYLTYPGVEGNRQVDQAMAVSLIRRYSEFLSGHLKTVDPLRTLEQNFRVLWPIIVAVLEKAGYVFQGGRIIGVGTELFPNGDTPSAEVE